MTKKKVSGKNGEAVVIFKLLSDANRYRSIGLLMRSKKALTVSDIAKALDMHHSATSHQLGSLHAKGIVQYKKNGREAHYMLGATPLAKRIARIMKSV